MPPKKKKLVHAQVSSPVLIRKTILETSILSIENLKILKNIKQIKRRKAKLKIELRKLCREIKDTIINFEDYLPDPQEVGITTETKRELQKTAREEERKRKSQEKLLVKSLQKEENPFEQKDEFDFDIEKLKDKINQL